MPESCMKSVWSTLHFGTVLLVGQLVVLFFKAFRCCYCYHLNPARKQRPIAPKLDYDTWTTPRHVSGQGPGVRHRKPSNSVQAMLERKTGKYWESKLASSLLIMFGLVVWFLGLEIHMWCWTTLSGTNQVQMLSQGPSHFWRVGTLL